MQGFCACHGPARLLPFQDKLRESPKGARDLEERMSNDKENKIGPNSYEQLQVADKPPPPSGESVSGQPVLPRQRDPLATVTLDEFGMTRRFGPLT